MQPTNIKISIKDKKFLKNEFGSLQNAINKMIEKEKEFIKKQKEFMATMEGKNGSD